MRTETEFCLLGPLMVRSGTAVLPVPQGMQRVVLAALLLSAGRVVSLDQLADALWGAEPPPSARVAIQNHVMRLRRSLGVTGSRIRTRPPGYLICADDSEVDVTRFQAYTDAARAAARECAWETAATEARAALGLWRGEPLADVDSEALALLEAPRLAEMRLQTLETRIDADLRLGRAATVIPELQQLTAAHPLRERLHGLLMSALYYDSRQAEALATYQQARAVLVEELGTEPGTGLRTLHQQILTDSRIPDAMLSVPPPMIPRQLPGAVRHFTGREREQAMLTELIGPAGSEQSGTAVISAIGGTAGVGKTALAVHWAHQVAQRFPDGQLYADLHGYGPGQPMSPADALAGFLRALGVPGQDIPPGEAERAARYRSLLAGRQMLVLLDNARSADQIRPLLPGTPTCATVATSRDSLAGLVARDGAVRVDVGFLPQPQAISLLRALIGRRVDAEPDATAALAEQCCRLPLALRITAELAIMHPGTSLAALAGELADQQRRLDLLDADADPRTAVRAVFSWSYQYLDPSTARAFRLLGLHPGLDLDSYAAAALTATTHSQAVQVLDLLTRAHLIQAVQRRRYAMHDLLRAYARELAIGNDDADDRHAGLSDLFDYYLHAAATATGALYPAERYLRPRDGAVPRRAPATATPVEALNWLNAERANLVAVAAYAASHGWPEHATRLSATLSRYLEESGHYADAILVHSHAVQAAGHRGNKTDAGRALNSLGSIEHAQGRYQQGADYLAQALALFREAGDPLGEAMALNNIGLASLATASYPQAAHHLRQSLILLRRIRNKHGEAIALGNLGVAEHRQGRTREAADCFHQALELCRETGDESCAADTLIRLGAMNLQQNRHEQAAGQIREALSVFRAIGGRSGEARALMHLGEVSQREARYPQAADQLRQALTLFRGTGDKLGHVSVLNSLGEAELLGGQPAEACRLYATALEMASQAGMKHEQARAHHGLGRGYHTAGELSRARDHMREALAIYMEIGAPEAGPVTVELATHARRE